MMFPDVAKRSFIRRQLVAAGGGIILFFLAVIWPPLAQGQGNSMIQTLSVVSSHSSYFQSGPLPSSGGTVYFNNLPGQGEGQILAVSVTGGDDIARFEGGPAFGMIPTPALTETGGMWVVNYTVNGAASDYPGVVFTLTNQAGASSTTSISFILDATPPTISNAHIDENNSRLYADGTTLYYADIFSDLGVPFAVAGDATDNSGAGLLEATFSSAFGGMPDPDDTPAEWSGTYNAKNSGGPSGLITVTVTDQLANSATQTFNYIQDTIGPTSTIASAQIVGSQISLPWIADDSDGSGPGTTILWYRRNSGGSWNLAPVSGQSGTTGTFSFTPSQDGTYFFGAQATDNVNNQEAQPGGDGDQRVLFDTMPPMFSSVQLTENSNDLYFNGATLYYDNNFGGSAAFTISGLAADDAASQAELAYIAYADVFQSTTPLSEALSGYSAAWSHSYSVQSSDDGNGVITATVYDGAALSETITYGYVEDVHRPSSSINSTQIVDDQISLPWTASDGDGSGVQTTELWYRRNSGGSWAAAPVPDQSGTAGTFVFTPGQDGTYFFGSRSTDNLGKLELAPTGSGEQMVIFDTISPTLSSVQLIENSPYLYLDGQILYYSNEIVSSALVTISGAATDDPTSEAELDYVAYADAFASTSPLTEALSGYSATWSHTYTVDNSHQGSGVLTATVYDGAGHWARSSFTYAQDVADPTILSISVAANDSQGTSFHVSWSTTDPTPSAGILDYEVQYRVDQGPWQTWLASIDAKTATFGPSDPEPVDLGKTYQFRVRARDNVGHQGDFSVSPVFNPPLATVYLPAVMSKFSTSSWDEFYEENDEQEQAFGPLQSGKTYLAYPDDVEDFYFFTVNNAALAEILLTNFIVGEGDLLLYRDNGNGTRTFIKNVGFYNPTMNLLAGSLPPGKYLVRIRTTAGPSTTNLYQLMVTTQVASPPWNQFLEENDDQAQAFGPLQPGQAYLAYPDDVEDFYTFSLNQAANVNVLLTNFIVGEGDLLLYRDNGDGTRSFIKNVGFYSPSMSLDASLSAGTYLVRVRTTAGTSVTNLYKLTVTY